MSSWWSAPTESLLHLFFPHCCASCGTDLPDARQPICIRCRAKLPYTDYPILADNPVEQIFWGRLPVRAACSILYFTRRSMLQQLLHRLKYGGQESLGIALGQLMGHALSVTKRFNGIDLLVPLPLHPTRERKRGYNQASLLCRGMRDVLDTPMGTKLLIREVSTKTQTQKTRTERWMSMQGKFRCIRPEGLKGKRVALIDDVITTGASLESCGQVILDSGARSLDIITLAYTLR